MASSDSTSSAPSDATISRMRWRTASALWLSPEVPAMAVVKKYLSSKMPRSVAMYLCEVTRLTVLSCISTASAMSRRISGRRWLTPWRKNPSCCRTISAATFRMVCERCCSDFTSQLAVCSFSATNALSSRLALAITLVENV